MSGKACRSTMLALGLALSCSPLEGQFAITSWTVDGGGGSGSGGSFDLHGTIGQPDASGPATVGSFSLTGGFWGGPGGSSASGYAAWAVTNIPPGLDASFEGDFNMDGLPNGLHYILGDEGVQALAAGTLTAPPGVVPADVMLILETSTGLTGWDMLLEYDAGAQTFLDPDVTILPGVLTHSTTDPARYYRYRAELLP